MLFQGIKSLSSDGWETLKLPSLLPIEVEWIGHKKGIGSSSPQLHMSEREKYLNLMKEVTSICTWRRVFVCVSAYFLVTEALISASRGDPSGFRTSVCRLTQLTQGRCVSVRYRLAPQHPFPAALLDVLTTYLSLLYPSPDSFHEPISASNIMIAGDSAGANLCLALIQLIPQLHRQNRSACTVRFFGKDVAIPLPAGVTAFSACTEVTSALPSIIANQECDYLATTMPLERVVPCGIWPTIPSRGALYCDISAFCHPLRGALYCDISAFCHPLVSPTIVETWTGALPMWFCCGEEMLVDDSRVITQRPANRGCTVLWVEYEAMPHCFPFILDVLQKI